MIQNEVREAVRDYLNDDLKEVELLSQFWLSKCPICENYELEEDMLDTEGKSHGGIGDVCPQCYEDGDVGR